MKTRDSYFDNLKCLLIYLVVAGHFLLPIQRIKLLSDVFHLIYAFHMPCFIFVSGYFAKSLYRNGRFRFDKVVTVLWLYLIFELLVYPTENLAAGGPWPPFDIFTESGAPWYLLALAFWYLTLPLVSRLKAWLVMPAALIVGLACGYNYSIHYFLALSRTLAFAPFFYAGYYFRKESVERLLTVRCRTFLILLFIPAALFVFKGANTFLAPYSSMVYGINYSHMGEAAALGGYVRLVWYLLATVLMLGVMAMVPRNKTIFTGIGVRTLQIYMLHRPIRDLCQYFRVYEYQGFPPMVWLVVLLTASVVLVWLLANPLLTKIFDVISTLPGRLINCLTNRS